MAQSNRKFEVIEETENEPAPSQAIDTLLAGLKALPQKTAAIAAAGFALLTAISVFCLALLIIPYTPSVLQLTGLGGYALFILAINIINRKR